LFCFGTADWIGSIVSEFAIAKYQLSGTRPTIDRPQSAAAPRKGLRGGYR
jgi:hypothetical protein